MCGSILKDKKGAEHFKIEMYKTSSQNEKKKKEIFSNSS